MATTRKRVTRKTSRPSSVAARKQVATDAKLESAATDAGKARTLIYVHGIGNKPEAEILKCQWDEALFGFSLGERSRLAYWVNRIFYPEPSKATCSMPDATHDGTPAESTGVAIRAIADPKQGVAPLLPEDATKKKEREALENIAREALQKNGRPKPPAT